MAPHEILSFHAGPFCFSSVFQVFNITLIAQLAAPSAINLDVHGSSAQSRMTAVSPEWWRHFRHGGVRTTCVYRMYRAHHRFKYYLPTGFPFRHQTGFLFTGALLLWWMRSLRCTGGAYGRTLCVSTQPDHSRNTHCLVWTSLVLRRDISLQTRHDVTTLTTLYLFQYRSVVAVLAL